MSGYAALALLAVLAVVALLVDGWHQERGEKR